TLGRDRGGPRPRPPRGVGEQFDANRFASREGASGYAVLAAWHLVTWKRVDFGKGPLRPVEDEVRVSAACAAHLAETGQPRTQSQKERATQAAILRCLFGNPFAAPPCIAPSLLRWTRVPS